MNILFIAHEQMINGASHSMIDIIDKLSDRCNFTIVTPFNNGPFVDEMKKRNVEIYYAPFYIWVDFKNDEYKTKRKHFKKSYDKINQIEKRKIAKKCTKIYGRKFCNELLNRYLPWF